MVGCGKGENPTTSNAANEVLKIIISPRDNEDTLTWTLEHNSMFSIRSAYRLFKDRKLKMIQEGVQMLGDRRKFEKRFGECKSQIMLKRLLGELVKRGYQQDIT